ncbi:MAG: thioredoxin domain-containing protein [Bacteroidia bacterium]|nr:thioredoxin domain-containing protein [Bacteroidia bacterium]
MANRLAQESSPYLLQHANNPVDWYAWGPEALAKAKAENKLMLISIGYAACHWCHVMEHESFEDEEVARLMNEYFVCIKVDREERPDVDKVYMDAVQLMTGRGGWPLNAVALPDGKPVYGGTYFRKDQWIDALKQVAGLWKNRPDQATEYAAHLLEAMQKLQVDLSDDRSPFALSDLEQIRSVWIDQLDFKWGGRQTKANKFPLPQNLLMLLRAGHLMQEENMIEAAEVTLEKMAYGGIYDHVGGGFARYSVDEYWKVPHFEKMLYDNGQLVSAYAEAYQYSGRERYRKVVEDTLGFIERELKSPEGGFYSSLDADSEGEEGKFYTWSYEEIGHILKEDAKLFCDYYNVHPFGNWEGSNILFVLEEEEEFAQRWKLDAVAFSQMMAAGRSALLAAREPRVRPGLDDKILTSWNALMLKGYVDAYRVIKKPEYLQIALENAAFLTQQLSDGYQLFRNFKNGRASIPAFLDDYAYLIDALTALYQVTFDKQWLDAAVGYVAYADAHFFDASSGLYFYTSAIGEQLVNRKMETQDDVIPSSNAVMAANLQSLGLLLDKPEWRDQSLDMLLSMKKDLLAHPAWHSRWGQLLLTQIFPHYEVVIMGPESVGMRLELEEQYYPNRIFAGGDQENLPILVDRSSSETTIYVCEGFACQLPVKTREEAWHLMDN